MHNIFNRISRANDKSLALTSSIQSWFKEYPITLKPTIRQDRRSWELAIELAATPPIDEWAVEVSEIVGHLRAALDNQVMLIAKKSEIVDIKALGRLKFPICETEEGWNKEKKSISCLPVDCQERIEQVQPFQRGRQNADSSHDPLVVLRELSNSDKHYELAIPSPSIEKIGHSMQVEFVNEQEAALSIPPDMEVMNPGLRSGEVVLRHNARGAIKSVQGSMELIGDLQISVKEHRLNVHDLVKMSQYVRGIVDYIEGSG
jgi:hypothetical protein